MKWEFEEEILLIYLYDYSKTHEKDDIERAIIELSVILNDRAREKGLPVNERYRNITGIKMKLANIRFLDSDGKLGLSSVSEMDKSCFDIYKNQTERFWNLVSKTKAALGIHTFLDKEKKINQISDVSALFEVYGVDPNEYLNCKISDTNLSVRVKNRLHHNGIFTVEQLLKKTAKELLSYQKFGLGCLNDVEQFCSVQLNSQLSKNESANLSKNIVCRNKRKILSGDFDTVLEDCKTDREIEIVERYREAYNSLSLKLVTSCVYNSEKIVTVIKMLERFVSCVRYKEEIRQLVSSISQPRRRLRYYPFVPLFSRNNEEISMLRAVGTEKDTFQSLAKSVRIDNEDIFGLVSDFLKLVKYDLNQDMEGFFSNLYKNEKVAVILPFRAKGRTLGEIGSMLQLTRERVRQIEKKAMDKFSIWQTRNKLVLKISAEYNGKSIIWSREIKEFFLNYSEEILYLLKNNQNKYYTYDSQYDAFSIGDNSVFKKTEQFIAALPNIVPEDDLIKMISESLLSCELSEELINKAISIHLVHTGRVYHKSKLSLARVYDSVLKKYYSNGIKVYDDEELGKFRSNISEMYGDIPIPDNNRALSARIVNVGILCGRGCYKPRQEQYISAALAEKIHQYILSAKESVFLMNTVYCHFKTELNLEGIDNKYYLQGILKDLYGSEFVFRRDYLSKDGTDTSLYNEIVRLIKNSKYPVSKKQIQEAFPGITDIVISFAVSDTKILNYFGEYLHASRLQITQSEKEYLKDKIEKLVEDKKPHHVSEIYDIVNKEKPEVFSRNAARYLFPVFSILEYIFEGQFSFSRPFFSSLDIDIERPVEKVNEMIYSKEKHNINDIIVYARSVRYTFYSIIDLINSVNDAYFMIDNQHIQKIESIGVTEEKVAQMESLILSEINDCTPIVSLQCICQFAPINVAWNEWLIYSVLLRWSTRLEVSTSSNQFRLSIPLVAPKGKLTDLEKQKYEYFKESEFVQADNLDNIDELISDYIIDGDTW